jgi:hypothetical protein
MSISPQTCVRAWIGLLGICLAVSLPFPRAAGQEPAKAKWEYCDLTRITRDGSKLEFILTLGKERIVGPSLRELGEKLKMKSIPVYTVAVLDHLGEEGWELVAYTSVIITPGNFTETYLFKRKR